MAEEDREDTGGGGVIFLKNAGFSFFTFTFNQKTRDSMDDQNTLLKNIEATVLSKKSWTAYIGTSIWAFFLIFGLVPLAWRSSTLLGIFLFLLAIMFLAYKALIIASHELYYDHAGVWIYSGILPWNKGVRGVKWRDLDEAIYFQSMSSWLFKSYSMRVGHRFTKSSEILLTHMDRADKAVIEINTQHQELASQNLLR